MRSATSSRLYRSFRFRCVKRLSCTTTRAGLRSKSDTFSGFRQVRYGAVSTVLAVLYDRYSLEVKRGEKAARRDPPGPARCDGPHDVRTEPDEDAFGDSRHEAATQAPHPLDSRGSGTRPRVRIGRCVPRSPHTPRRAEARTADTAGILVAHGDSATVNHVWNLSARSRHTGLRGRSRRSCFTVLHTLPGDVYDRGVNSTEVHGALP